MSEVFYVYKHVDPETKEIVYIGMGQKSRAWDMGTGGGPKRSKEHFDWFSDLEEKGFILDEIVSVPYKRLTRGEAYELEKALIKDHQPCFNLKQGRKPILTKKDIKEILSLRKEGWTITDLSSRFNVSDGTIYRVLISCPEYKRLPKNQYSPRGLDDETTGS